MEDGREVERASVAAWMHTLRHDYLRWTQQEVAEAIGVTALTVGLWERGGQIPNPLCYEALSALAKSVGAPAPPDVDRRRGPRSKEGAHGNRNLSEVSVGSVR